MRWITREKVKVDRVACPWLIRRFIDPQAEFLFVPSDEVAAVAATGAIPFDVANVELGHKDGRCSFESFIHSYKLEDPALHRLARIVHGADVTADLDQAPEARGLLALAEGFQAVFGERDQEKLEAQMPVYDALYAWCRRSGASAA